MMMMITTHEEVGFVIDVTGRGFTTLLPREERILQLFERAR
jgi:hypothetical protein